VLKSEVAAWCAKLASAGPWYCDCRWQNGSRAPERNATYRNAVCCSIKTCRTIRVARCVVESEREGDCRQSLSTLRDVVSWNEDSTRMNSSQSSTTDDWCCTSTDSTATVMLARLLARLQTPSDDISAPCTRPSGVTCWFFTDHFSGPRRAIEPLCVCVCVQPIIVKQNDIWRRYLAPRWFTLLPVIEYVRRSRSSVKVLLLLLLLLLLFLVKMSTQRRVTSTREVTRGKLYSSPTAGMADGG